MIRTDIMYHPWSYMNQAVQNVTKSQQRRVHKNNILLEMGNQEYSNVPIEPKINMITCRPIYLIDSRMFVLFCFLRNRYHVG